MKNCMHDLTKLRIIGNNITCLDCKTTWVKLSPKQSKESLETKKIILNHLMSL